MDEYPTDFVSIGTVEDVYTTHVTHQEQFYVHLDTRSRILEEVMEKLETRYSQLGPNDKTLSQIKPGGLCAAKFTDDNNWYRAKITGVHNNGLIEVNFVDYGNTDYVGADRVKNLDPDLMQYPVQSYRCALAGVSCQHGIWTPELRVQFEDLVIDKQCKAVFKGKTGDDIYLLDMFDEQGSHINKLFGAAECKRPATNAQANRNGRHTSQGFDTVVWNEGQTVRAVVVYVSNPDMFWCQEVEHTNHILVLSEELSRLHMTQEMGPLQDIRPGAICAAKFHVDDDWYRGIIQSLSRNQAQVYFVDYGNTENVALDSICELRPQFRNLPALAVKCSMSSLSASDGSNWSPEATEEFEKLVVDKEFELNVIKRRPDSYDVSLLDVEENRDVASQLKQILSQSGIKARSPPKVDNVKNNNNNNQSHSRNRGLDFSVGSTSDVFLSWIDNPVDFWVQLDSASDTLDKLSSDLQEYYAQPRPTALSAPGAFVIARYSEDQRWYRGLVVKEFDDLVKVLFIDYGNADTIPKSELRQVNPQFGQIDPLAFRCSLKGIKPLPQDNTWSVDAKDFLEKLTENGCQCEVLSKNEAYRFVNLKVNGRDVTQELVSVAVVAGSQSTSVKSSPQSYSPSPRLHENQVDQVMVTHIDSPRSFWVQLNKNSSDLDTVMERLENHYSEEGGTPISRPAVGQPCVAQYSLDNAWYRAVITNITPSGCDVHFVDYGNKELVAPNLVCVAEPRFLDLPSQAIRCSLLLPGDVSALTDAFSDLVLEKDVSLKVLAGGEVPTVDLMVQGESISSLLRNQSGGGGSNKTRGQSDSVQGIKQAKPIPEGSTVKAFTSMVHNPGRFFLQLSGTEEELSSLMDQLTTKYVPQGVSTVSQPSVGTHCVALYQDDNQWYRGKITSVHGDQCQVLFVDYGNEEFVDNGLVKVLTPEISSFPILAYECSLNGVQVDEWSESSIECFESLVMDQELSCTFDTQSKVTISCNGEDVAKKLIAAGHCRPSAGVAVKSPLTVSTSSFGGGRPQKSPGFGLSPRKEESSPGGFGGGKREERGFGENRDDNRGFGGGRQNNYNEGRDEKRGFGGGGNRFGEDREDKRGFGGGGNRFGEDREDKRGFGGGRREGRGFGGEGREDRGGRRFGGGDDSGSHRSDEGSEKGGFKSRSRDGGDSGFGGKRGGGDGAGFGGGRRERNFSADSSGSTADKFTYADPPSEPENAILVHIDDNGTFYLQLPSMEKDILFLSKRLAGSYKTGGPRLRGTAEKGTVCCCKFPDDGSMYRCQVEAVDGNQIMVRYMDYGNIAEHTTFDLKFLFPDLLQYPVQAFPCKLRGLEWSLEKADMFGSATLDKDLEVTFFSTTAPFEVDIKTPDGDLLSIMTGKTAPPAAKISSPGNKTSGAFGARSPKGFGSRGGMDTSTPKKFDSPVKRSLNLSSPAKPMVPKQVFVTQSAPVESQTAFISHIAENGQFYLQLEKDTDLLESLTEKLKNLDSNTPHPDLSKGAACGAVFSEDSSWYRAKISEVMNDQYTVTFVDFGNGDKVSKENIRPLSEDLLSAAPLAYQCSFAGEDEALSDTAKEKLEEFLMEHQLTVSFSSQSSPFAVSATTSDGQDLHEIVCPSNQFRSHVIPKDVTPAGVCHIEDDGRFFVCFYKQYKAKDNLQKRLQEYYTSAESEPLENLDVDSPCCLKSPVDDQWHRCCIKSSTDSKAEVQYVDNGNYESVDTTDLRSLPINFLKEPPFALECRLKGVESWTDDLKEKFIDMTKDKILNATFYTAKPPYRVSLARSIELDLLGLNAPEPDSPRKAVDDSVVSDANMNRSAVFQGGDSYITETTSQGIFYAQLVSEENQLQSLSDNLDALLATEHTQPDTVEVGSTVGAKFTEDDVWYRATLEELDGDKFTVRFVDYGNTDTLGKDRLALLPDELSTISIPAFAYKCKLSTPMSQVEEFKAAVLDKMVTIEVVSTEDDGVFIVNVTLDGHPVEANQAATTEEANSQQEEVVSSGSGERKTVIVPFVTSPGQFYVQLQDQESQLDSMMNDLYEDITALAEGEGLVSEDIAVGDMCAALYEESWYRVKVVSFGEEDQSVQVLYVDHGNTETVSDRTELRALPEKYQSLPLFGHEATLPGIKPVDEDWTEEAIEAFRALVEEKSLLADMLDVNSDKWVVQLLDMGTPVQDTLIVKGHGVATESAAISTSTKHVFSEANESSVVVTENVAPAEEEKSWKKKLGCISDKVEELKEVKAFVSHVDNPAQMWCQLASSTDDLEELADKLESLYATPQDSDSILGDIKNSALVVGLFEDDGSRYRSVVVGKHSDNDKILLRFIDYGNCGLCSRDQILNIREELCNQPALSFCCCLDKIQPLEEEWSSEVCSRVTELTADQELLLTLVGRKQDGTALVDLIVPETGKSLSSILIEEGLVKSLDIDTSLPVARHETEKGDVSECLEITQPIMESTAMVDETTPLNNYQDYSFGYAEDGYYRCIELNLHSSYAILVCNDELPNAFCVQLKELEGQLSTLLAEIQEHVESHGGDDYSPKIGDPCLVKHESEWQRGLIRMENNDGSYIVYAVDIGWELSVKTDKIRSMPTQFLDLPSQAVHCYLAGVVSMEPEWSAEAINFFTEYIRDHDLHINVLESAEDGKYGVSMTTMQDSSTEYAGSSVNHLMVDLGYSDIVPGSNIEVQYDMERTLDTDMLNELEESFKEVETEKNLENKDKASDDTEASASQVDTFATTQEEESVACKELLEVGSKFYQIAHLSKSEIDSQSVVKEEQNSDMVILTKKDLAFDIASAVDRIDQMGCIDLFPEDCLFFDVTSDVDSMLEVSKGNKSLANKENEGTLAADVNEACKTTPQRCSNGDGQNVIAKKENKSPLYTWSQPASHENDAPTTAANRNDISNDNKKNDDGMPLRTTDGIDNTVDGPCGQSDEISKSCVKMEFDEPSGPVNSNEGSNAADIAIKQENILYISQEINSDQDKNKFENDHRLNCGEVLENDYEEDASYITLDQTGFHDNSEGEADLTDGYHGSVSDGVGSNTSRHASDCTQSLEQEGRSAVIRGAVKDGGGENTNDVLDCEVYEDASCGDECNEVDTVSFDIAKVMVKGSYSEGISNGEISDLKRFKVDDVRDFTDTDRNNSGESKFSEPGKNKDERNGRYDELAALVPNEVHSIQESQSSDETIKHPDGMNKLPSGKDFAPLDNGNQEIEEMNVCDVNVKTILDNISSSGDLKVKDVIKPPKGCISSDMKYGVNYESKDGDCSVKGPGSSGLPSAGSPDSASLEGSMFESCLEPGLNGLDSSDSCQEDKVNDPQHRDVTPDTTVEVEEVNTKESFVRDDTKYTEDVVEAAPELAGEQEEDEEDGYIASVSTLDDTYDNYESASETCEDLNGPDSFYNSSGCLVIDESAGTPSDLTESSFDRSELDSSDCGPESSSCYDTSSLVFSDSQLDSSYADTSNTSTSTQTTEVSGYSVTDTSSTYNEISSFSYDDSDQTAADDSISSLSVESLDFLNGMVKTSHEQGKSCIDVQNVSCKGKEVLKSFENQKSDIQAIDARQESTDCDAGNEHLDEQDIGKAQTDAILSNSARQIPVDELLQHKIIARNENEEKTECVDTVIFCGNGVDEGEQEKRKVPEMAVGKTTGVIRNAISPQSVSYSDERDDDLSDKKSKANSEHSGPASFHSADDDDEDEVIRGNLEESAPAEDEETDSSNTKVDGDEEENTSDSEKEKSKSLENTDLEAEDEAETKENENDKEEQVTVKPSDTDEEEEKDDGDDKSLAKNASDKENQDDDKDKEGQAEMTAKEVIGDNEIKVVPSNKEAEVESLGDKDESEA